jgi:hypothetical protein
VLPLGILDLPRQMDGAVLLVEMPVGPLALCAAVVALLALALELAPGGTAVFAELWVCEDVRHVREQEELLHEAMPATAKAAYTCSVLRRGTGEEMGAVQRPSLTKKRMPLFLGPCFDGAVARQAPGRRKVGRSRLDSSPVQHVGRRSECRGKVFDFDKSSFTRVILPDASARAEKKRRMFERL